MNRYALCRYNEMLDQSMTYRDTASRWIKMGYATLVVAAVCAVVGQYGAALVWLAFYAVEVALAWRAFTVGWGILSRAQAELIEHRRVEAYRETV